MSHEELRTGVVIDYPFLWPHEAQAGETEGRKQRPTTVGFRIPRPGQPDLLMLFPITSRHPAKDRFAVEIPEIEKRRAGLDADMRLWLILDQFNTDIVGSSFYLLPDAPRGYFSDAFFLPLMRAFINRRKEARAVNRA
jgi:hypothetical protein